MDLEQIASELRGSRRKRPVTAKEGCPEESVDRIRSSVASKWIASVAASPRMAPRRPQSSPTRHTFRGALTDSRILELVIDSRVLIRFCAIFLDILWILD